jgi:hypothetical protein
MYYISKYPWCTCEDFPFYVTLNYSICDTLNGYIIILQYSKYIFIFIFIVLARNVGFIFLISFVVFIFYDVCKKLFLCCVFFLFILYGQFLDFGGLSFQIKRSFFAFFFFLQFLLFISFFYVFFFFYNLFFGYL